MENVSKLSLESIVRTNSVKEREVPPIWRADS